MVRIHKSALAESDLTDIWISTFERWGERQADKYFSELEDGFALLADNPRLGKARDDILEGFRSLLLGRHVAFYTISPDTIQIVRVLHVRMDPDGHI